MSLIRACAIVGAAAAVDPFRGLAWEGRIAARCFGGNYRWIPVDPLSISSGCPLPSIVSRKTTLPLIRRCERPHYPDERLTQLASPQRPQFPSPSLRIVDPTVRRVQNGQNARCFLTFFHFRSPRPQRALPPRPRRPTYAHQL